MRAASVLSPVLLHDESTGILEVERMAMRPYNAKGPASRAMWRPETRSKLNSQIVIELLGKACGGSTGRNPLPGHFPGRM
jgi:hypothetical protein